ncbi:hypothetical protein M9H77_01190 [Catharanthus roseus]|uniref:Uncharacterized protein n=1 Tax=Catharanthus roseus TaxID=4058 RepID=A0ACC0C5B9_CATRO|nr:hypothetical protein M9H77_01190 [Catharanthus roseus]
MSIYVHKHVNVFCTPSTPALFLRATYGGVGGSSDFRLTLLQRGLIFAYKLVLGARGVGWDVEVGHNSCRRHWGTLSWNGKVFFIFGGRHGGLAALARSNGHLAFLACWAWWIDSLLGYIPLFSQGNFIMDQTKTIGIMM